MYKHINDMKYISTRGDGRKLSASQAILKGLADDGGLFMPEKLPVFDFELKDLVGRDYKNTAYRIMRLYFTDYSEDELKECIDKAYDGKFDTESIIDIKHACGAFYIELFHGATIAFKDMALSILPHLMKVAAKKNNIHGRIVILTATSGDTGKAAMSGFADVEGTRIIVFYPKGGVSSIQELQMTTQKGANVEVFAVHGNFDDAQASVKKIFSDHAFKKLLTDNDIMLSSANSINIGRLVPQIVYYVHAYIKLLEAGDINDGEKVNVCVPTGNFGNILAAYFAKLMGLPVNKLICASNENKVLFDFFKTGIYDKNRNFTLTISPSMDILISSNFERLIYLSCGCSGAKTSKLMYELYSSGHYSADKSMMKFMSDFTGGFASEYENLENIKRVYKESGYIIDPHTSVASSVYEKYKNESHDDTKTLIAATASPYKFAKSVMGAIADINGMDDWEVIEMLNKTSGVAIPKAVIDIKDAPVIHKLECDIELMGDMVKKVLGLKV